ncbi:hypothetical protein HDU79_007678 [Rhizoclosmatium sp. JEL0117]|nr:hypothetical protein HDU79_007678 [Rhizoclosmatium sp. JEL0117]
MELLSDFDKSQLVDKQGTTASTTLNHIDSILTELVRVRGLVSLDESGSEAALQSLPLFLKRGQAASLESHKSLHSAASKVAKAVEKRFKQDANLDLIWNPRALSTTTKEHTLNKAIEQHLIREGRFSLAARFAHEAQLSSSSSQTTESSDDALNAKFNDMFSILSHIKQFNLDPAINWVNSHSTQLAHIDSTLEFSVTRLQFLKLLFGVAGVSSGDRNAALQYAQLKFNAFKDQHMKEIQKLMCCLLYTSKINQSPYKALTETTAWSDLSHQFTRDFCLLLSLPAESPLHTCISVGVNALPTIIKMSSILKEQSGLEWSSTGELPVEIPLLDRQRFHSVFACPVSKELGTKENPPMMMVCGHVVCNESLKRLGKGSMTNKFKCPYCPSEGKGEQAILIHF